MLPSPFSILFKLSSPNQLLQLSKHRLVINLHRWALFEQAGVHWPQRREQQGVGVGAPHHSLLQAFPVSRRFLGSPDLLELKVTQDIWFCQGRQTRENKFCETLMEPGKRGGRRFPLLSCLLLSCSMPCDHSSQVWTWKMSKCCQRSHPENLQGNGNLHLPRRRNILEALKCFNTLELFLLLW